MNGRRSRTMSHGCSTARSSCRLVRSRTGKRPTILDSDAKEIHIHNNNVRGIAVKAIKEGDGVVERIVGRFLAENIDDAETGERIASIDDMVDREPRESR